MRGWVLAGCLILAQPAFGQQMPIVCPSPDLDAARADDLVQIAYDYLHGNENLLAGYQGFTRYRGVLVERDESRRERGRPVWIVYLTPFECDDSDLDGMGYGVEIDPEDLSIVDSWWGPF